MSSQRQFCWAHFTRNLLSALDVAPTASARRFCREALALERQLFRLWHRFRGDPSARGAPLTRQELVAEGLPIEKNLFALGDRYVNAANADVRNLARALPAQSPRSAAGELAVARLLTVTRTCQLPQLNALVYRVGSSG